ncbi:MAG: radical SAM protein [Chloroflexi bacterium]|nr:radical SAM protein [Chloroflexota bacterium]
MNWLNRRRRAQAFLPCDNPTFKNPDFETASYRVLIVRLSPFRDVDRSLPHLFLFHEVRQALPDAFVDMAFFPSASERKLLERADAPALIGTQSLRLAEDFDLVLISNAYTLELINLPYLLIHSNIPLFASQRRLQKAKAEWPIIILGGSNAMAAQSIVRADGDSLVDGIFFGEGEGWVGSLVSLLSQNRQKDKRQVMEQITEKTPGLWVAGSLCPTQKAVLHTPEATFLPTEYPILNSPEAHTASLQINYGCPAFCSFCFEGYDRKPYRELALPDVLAAARQIKGAQGVEELNLYSFNFNTHQDVLPMVLELHKLFDRVSFKSQRVDILRHTPGLLAAEVEADKREFTLGIEGISDRLRAWMHKSLPTDDVTALLDRIFGLKVRRVKLFYILTGHETDEDIDEFRQFLQWLKEARRRSQNRRLRVVFSFGLLIRMPFTPLRYDRLFLDEQEWKPLIGRIKSACETNGFEFRLAFDWADYCVSQVLAMGGHWLVEPIVMLAREGYCFDTAMPPQYWDKLKGWMEEAGHWNDAFLGEKEPDYPFALEFVESNISGEFLYCQYQEAQSGVDSGYCLGNDKQPGRCLGCEACVDQEQRRSITHHQIRQPERSAFQVQLREVMARKRRLQPVYFRLRLEPWLAGLLPEYLNAFVFQEFLVQYPKLVDNLLSVRESLFTLRPSKHRFPSVSGETIFALKAWNVRALETGFFYKQSDEIPVSGFEIIDLADGFTPGVFNKLHLDVHLPAHLFPEPRIRLEEYLRGAYVRYSLRRDGARYRFEIPSKALKKKVVFGGFFETRENEFFASLDVGFKFDFMAFLQTFGKKGLHHRARACVSEIEW